MKLKLQVRWFLLLILLSLAFLCLGLTFGNKSGEIHKNPKWQVKQNRITASELVTISKRLQKTVANKQLRKSGPGVNPQLATILNNKSHLSLNLRAARERAKKLSGLKIYWHEKNGTPVFVTGEGLQRQTQSLKMAKTASATQLALAYFEENRDLFKLENPGQELQVVKELYDDLGKQHVKFQQVYQGIPIWGHDLVAHLTSDGTLYAINARYSPTPRGLDINRVIIGSEEAIQIAESNLAKETAIKELGNWARTILDYEGPSVKKYIWVDSKTQKPHLIWHVAIRPNFRDYWYYFIDVVSGDVLEKYNATNFDGPTTATAVDLNGVTQTINVYELGGTFYMIDASRDIFKSNESTLPDDPKGALVTRDAQGTDLQQVEHVTSSDNTWKDPVSVSAHFNVGKVFEYYETTYGRQGIDDKGSTIISVIHVTKGGQPMDNAYWNQVLMVYGDGNQSFKPLAGALDVAAHEMTHGVIQYTVNLEYKFQSGALNESFADVFGVMVDRDDWLIGEDVTLTSYIPTGALRNMEDPHNGGTSRNDPGWQPSSMSEFLNLDVSIDNGGVHVNSGIPNRACFLIANNIGREKTEQIYYRVLDARYLNTKAHFIDLRLGAIQAATDLYGDPSTEVDAVKAAFDTVGITGDTGTPPPADLPPVQGQEFIAAVNGAKNDSSLFLIKPVIQNSETDIVQVSTTQVFTQTGNPISVSDDGSVIMFIDSQNFIRVLDENGESVISTEGIWSSIALSPAATKLAATSVSIDTTIYVFDLIDPEASKAIRLYTPTTAEGVQANNTLYADALDWDLSGQFLLYDAFNRIPQSSGSAIEYWDVNLLDVENEIIIPIFPPLPEGINIGNPSFAQTNDAFFVFDLTDLNQGNDEIWAVDLFKGTTNLIESNGSSIGYPRYSIDDSRLVFERVESGVPTLRQIPLAANRIEATGPSELFVTEGQRPNWFAIGQRPTAVEDHSETLPTAFILHQNYPNPFNPETLIRYELPVDASVTIAVYDILGRKVKKLETGLKNAGRHQFQWDGRDEQGRPVSSGIYLFRLEVKSDKGKMAQFTKKMTLLR